MDDLIRTDLRLPLADERLELLEFEWQRLDGCADLAPLFTGRLSFRFRLSIPGPHHVHSAVVDERQIAFDGAHNTRPQRVTAAVGPFMKKLLFVFGELAAC